MRKALTAAAAVVGVCSFAVTAFAASTSYSLFGDATDLGGGTVQLTSDASVAPGYAGMSFSVPSGLTFANLQTLSTDYNVTDDDCGGGSPRFSISLDTNNDGVSDGHIFAYLGPQPSYSGCAQNTWLSSGNLLDGSHSVDTSQLGGTFYDTEANAVANYGSAKVLSVSLVVDGSWAFADGEQTILVRNAVVNGATDINQCKNGGWQSLGFKNQGQCVSSVASKNK